MVSAEQKSTDSGQTFQFEEEIKCLDYKPNKILKDLNMIENPETMLCCHLRAQSSKALGYMLSFKHE